MRKTSFILLIILTLSITNLAQTKDVFKQAFPTSTLLKPTLTVRCVRDLRYWKQPNLDNFWSWMPKLQFAVSGPIDDASYLTYEFFAPDGNLWFKHDSAPFAVEEGSYKMFESEAVPSWQDKRSSIATGVFSFKVTLRNSLQGTSKLLYQGRFTVKKEFVGTGNAAFKNQNLFYVDQDWTLPMAYLNFDSKQDEDAPIFQSSMWFRGDVSSKLQGFLFYDGKQVSNTEVGGVGNTHAVLIEGDSDYKYRWEQNTFTFYGARYFDNKGGYQGRHIIKNKPGNYEVKILLDSELVRTVAFTVGADGKIVDNGVAKNNGLGGFGILVPAKVIPVKEGNVNLLSYKTDAFYGNILSGF
jgi:hypothetical protein